MDNEKEAEIIAFPSIEIGRNNPLFIPVKNVIPIEAHMHHKFNLAMYVSEGQQLVFIKLNLIGEIEITAGDKKMTKKIDLVVPIHIDEWETDEWED